MQKVRLLCGAGCCYNIRRVWTCFNCKETFDKVWKAELHEYGHKDSLEPVYKHYLNDTVDSLAQNGVLSDIRVLDGAIKRAWAIGDRGIRY